MPVNFGRDIAPRQIQALASYDYTDIAEGTGIVVYHGCCDRTTSGGFKYQLSRSGFYSDQIASGGIVTGGTDTKVQDLDFDVTFIKPQIVNGNALINCPIAVAGNVAASSYDVYVTVAVKKVSEGVVTEMFALSSGSLVHTAESFQSDFSAIKANLPLTHFAAGDILRLQVQLYGRGNGADAAHVLLGMDAKNRLESGALLRWTSGDTDLQFHVPFRLNT